MSGLILLSLPVTNFPLSSVDFLTPSLRILPCYVRTDETRHSRNYESPYRSETQRVLLELSLELVKVHERPFGRVVLIIMAVKRAIFYQTLYLAF